TADPAASHLTPQTFPDTPTGMDASAQVASATTGLWTVSVEGVGLAGSTGYSDYGSVGQYNLSITGCTGSGGVAPDAPTGGSVELTARSTSATIHWAAPVNHGDSAITGYAISGTPFAVANPGAGATSAVLTHLVPGTTYDVQVAATNSTGGNGAALTIPVRVQTWMPTTAPTMTVQYTKTKSENVIIDYHEPANPGNATFTTWHFTLGNQFDDGDYATVGGIYLTTGNGTFTVKLQLRGTADLGTATPTGAKSFVVGATAPRIGLPISGKKGKPVTVGIKWALPTSLGGYPITGWKAIAYKLTKSGGIGRGYITGMLGPRARSFVGRLPAGKYKFRVVVYNALGQSPASAYSRVGVAR
ncbi:MAG: fibronectin type III domain-containing protein, partial [Marmoricola sp.]